MGFSLVLRNIDADVLGFGKRRIDMGVDKGVIAAIEPRIEISGKQEIDCAGLVVSPGLIDLHVHAAYKLHPNSLDPDEIGIRSFVTSVADAGSVGAFLADAFADYVAARARTGTFGFLNVALDTAYPLGLVDPSNVDLGLTLRQLQRHPGVFRGVKVMASVTHLGIFGLEAVKMAKKAASAASLPLMAHIGNAPPVVDDVLDLLGEGDVVTHCFHGKPGGLFDVTGKPIAPALAALDRGVKFDIGHGSASFSYRTYLNAKEAGIPFHVISTDLHIANRNGPVFDLLTTMNKFLALGCSLKAVIGATTGAPAAILGLSDRGCFQVGKRADIAILRVKKGDFVYKDSRGDSFSGKEALEGVQAIAAGEVIWPSA